MPDDNQTVTEPRSAVEAASDPSHGGSFNAVQSVDVYTAYLQAQAQAAQQAVGTMNAPPPAAPTVKSGIGRLRGIRDEAEKLIGEFEGFVGEMEGNPPMNSSGSKLNPAQAGTAGAIHDAANDLRSVFSRLADLVKRAKAAHG